MRQFTIAALVIFSLNTSPAAQDPDLKTKDNIKGGPPPASPDGLPAGMTEDQMWPSPTREDWAKPVLVEFERSWADAVAVAKETNKAILVCVNMDGEPASEHYAGVHYRTPETAQLFEEYVCVIASVYRHTPKDYDEQGKRVLCPRFGSVTCDEHIWIEPLLYERFMNGQRISPRHIMVELDGNEVFDVFYAWDNKSIFDTITTGIAERQAEPRIIVRGDRPILDRVASRAREDREAVEDAYRQGNRELNEQLLRKAIENPQDAPIGLLRLAIFGLDENLARLARQALVKVKSPSAVDLIGEALRVPLPEEEREALVAALENLRGDSAWARILANVHRGLDSDTKTIDVQSWNAQISGRQVYRGANSQALDLRVAEREAAVQSAPQSAEALVDMAESSLELAINPSTADRYWGNSRNKYGLLMIEDVKRHVAAARKAGASGWRIDAIEALADFYSGKKEESYQLAVQAAKAMPPAPDSPVGVSILALFAEARINQIWAAMRKKEEWPGEWMTDVTGSYTVLATHPLGTDAHAAMHYDFLHSLRAHRPAGRVIEQAIERFPASEQIHRRLRSRLMRNRGVEGMTARYQELIDARPEEAALYWYAGYAAMVEAEFDRREKRPVQAVEAYDRSITLFDQSMQRDQGFEDSADHYVALALAAQARLAIESGDLDRSLELILAGISRRPEATPFLDGMEISPVQTARLLESRLEQAGKTNELKSLQGVLDSLDPELLRMPDYEPPGARQGRGQGRRGGRRRRGR
ncbi:MAG: hypothetical protein ACYTG5_17930 [Planctomycetota bacterium]|jgi:tetratricopeptide (TPR) repeat protein